MSHPIHIIFIFDRSRQIVTEKVRIKHHEIQIVRMVTRIMRYAQIADVLGKHGLGIGLERIFPTRARFRRVP